MIDEKQFKRAVKKWALVPIGGSRVQSITGSRDFFTVEYRNMGNTWAPAITVTYEIDEGKEVFKHARAWGKI